MEDQAVVTSYQCGGQYVDSTGRSPALTLVVPEGVPLGFHLEAKQQPVAVEVRLYSGTGVSGLFFRWPEELPTGVVPVDRLEPTPSLAFRYLPTVPPGEYSVVVRAVWEGPIVVFYALSFRLR